MLDIKFIREHTDIVKKAIADKQMTIDIDKLLTLDEQRRSIQQDLDKLRSLQNEASSEIVKAGPDEKQAMIEKMKKVSNDATEKKHELDAVEAEYNDIMLTVPQIPVEETPHGGEEANTVVKTHGEKTSFDFEPKSHLELMQAHHMVDVERGVKVMGTRGYYLTGIGAQLEQAILNYALEFMRERGFMQMQIPLLADESFFVGTGHLPFGGDELFKVYDQRLKKGEEMSEDLEPRLLAGTAEVALCAYHAGETLDIDQLPVKLMAMSPCFRTEVGSYGKDTSGLYRVKQFYKVEQVILCKADDEESKKQFAELLKNAEDFLQSLELPYQVIRNATGDMGAGKVEMFDIETWMPSRDNYGETHSCSRLGDWQARRLKIKYKDGDKNVFVHTLNNTLTASPRILIPLLENHQKADGSIHIPQALRPFMNGMSEIKLA